MSSTNFEMIWKNQLDDLSDHQMSLEEIRETTLSFSSDDISGSQKLVNFDTAYKGFVLTGYISLIFIGTLSFAKLLLTTVIITILICLIYRNRSLSQRLTSINESEPVMEVLRKRYDAIIAFYPEYFFNSSFTSPLFLFAGFQFYHLLRYGEDRFTELIADPVIYIFLILAFIIPYFAFKKTYSEIIQQMNKLLNPEINEIEQEINVIKIRTSRSRWKVISGILVALGLTLMLTILLSFL